MNNRRIKKELVIFAFTLLGTLVVNIYSVLKNDGDWNALAGKLLVIFFIAIIIYLLVLLFRLIILGIARVIKKQK